MLRLFSQEVRDKQSSKTLEKFQRLVKDLLHGKKRDSDSKGENTVGDAPMEEDEKEEEAVPTATAAAPTAPAPAPQNGAETVSAVKCPSCGALNPVGAKHCNQCGAEIVAPVS